MFRSLLRRYGGSTCAMRGHPLTEIVCALCPVFYVALGWRVCVCGKRSVVDCPPQLGIVEEKRMVGK